MVFCLNKGICLTRNCGWINIYGPSGYSKQEAWHLMLVKKGKVKYQGNACKPSKHVHIDENTSKDGTEKMAYQSNGGSSTTGYNTASH